MFVEVGSCYICVPCIRTSILCLLISVVFTRREEIKLLCWQWLKDGTTWRLQPRHSGYSENTDYCLLYSALGRGRHQISYLMKGHLNTFKCIALYKFELFKLWSNTFQRFIRFKYAKLQKLWNLQNIHHFGSCVDTYKHITFRVTI